MVYFLKILSTYAEICVGDQKGKGSNHVSELTNMLHFFPPFLYFVSPVVLMCFLSTSKDVVFKARDEGLP